MPDDKKEAIQKRERTTIDEARQGGIGEAEKGIAPTVPSYTDTGDVSDLGVDEPTVPRHLQGDPPPESDAEHAQRHNGEHGDTTE